AEFFFFQAEDGIRDWSVTGVQTCALPISGDRAGERDVGDRNTVEVRLELLVPRRKTSPLGRVDDQAVDHPEQLAELWRVPLGLRSEERRVGKESRVRWARRQWKKQ